jgi:iron complex outermembrane receptor protein
VWKGTWGLDGQYDFVRATFDDAAGGNVPRMPPHRAGAGVFYRDSNWFARVGFLHAFDQDKTGDNETSDQGLYPAERRSRLHAQAASRRPVRSPR